MRNVSKGQRELKLWKAGEVCALQPKEVREEKLE